MIIYKITNGINNKIYIGQTITDLKTRWRDHRRLKNRQMSPIKHSIQKYGPSNFIIEQIDEALTIEELNNKEQYWILFYNSTDRNIGYNLMSGGNSKGKHSVETIQKMKDSHTGKPRQPHSKETKELLSNIRKGKPAHNKGKPGKPNTAEQKIATSLRFKNKPSHNRFKGTKGEMYGIRKPKNRYQVIITKKFLGSFKTLEEAQFTRDEYIKTIIELEKKIDKQAKEE